MDGPNLLADGPDSLGAPAQECFADHCRTLRVVQAIGGPSAISVATHEAAEDAAESCGGQTIVGEPQ